MASAEARAVYAANQCISQDFMKPTNSSDHPSSAATKSESGHQPSKSFGDHANSGCISRIPSSERLPEMKWWLHVKTNTGVEANYTRQNMNALEAELGAYCARFVDDNKKISGDQSIKSFDAHSCIGSANSVLEQPWNSSSTCMKSKNDPCMPKIEASLKKDLPSIPKNKDQEECWFSDDHFMDWDLADFITSEQCKKTSFDLESHWIDADKAGPWWRTAGKDELASLVAQRSFEHIENCDLPQPQNKNLRKSPSDYLKGRDRDKTLPLSLNQKAKTGSSNVDASNTSGTLTSGFSFQDSDGPFSSSQSKDSDSINKEDSVKCTNDSKAELLEALCHSQTRARQAENAAQQAYNEKEHLLSLFFKQAYQLFAYKQWYQLLQLENLCLQLRNKNQPFLHLLPAGLPFAQYRVKQPRKSHRRTRKRKSSSRRHGIRKCVVAFAVGLGLAGAGLLLGWTMGWMFPLYK